MRTATMVLLTSALGAMSAACSATEPGKAPAPGGISSRAPTVTPAEVPRESARLPTVRVPPGLIDKMRADLARQIGEAAAQAAAVRAEGVTWPDGSLGCHEPGEMYTQQLVPGYRVEFAVGEQTYAYHAASKSGYFKLCGKLPRSIER